MAKKELSVINIGFCPRCKEELEGMMTRQVADRSGAVVFCHLCSFDVQEDAHQKRSWLKWARDYAKEMAPEESAIINLHREIGEG